MGSRIGVNFLSWTGTIYRPLQLRRLACLSVSLVANRHCGIPLQIANRPSRSLPGVCYLCTNFLIIRILSRPWQLLDAAPTRYVQKYVLCSFQTREVGAEVICRAYNMSLRRKEARAAFMSRNGPLYRTMVRIVTQQPRNPTSGPGRQKYGGEKKNLWQRYCRFPRGFSISGTTTTTL